MGRHVIWSPAAKGQLRAIEQGPAMRILRSLARYLETGQGDIKLLQDTDPPEFRLRVGDYRVLFHEHGDAVRVVSVKHRREVYR